MTFLGQTSEQIQQQAALERKKRLAEAMVKGLKANDPVKMVSGRVIPYDTIGEGLKAFGRMYGQKKISEIEDQETQLKKALADQKMKAFERFTGRIGQNHSPEIADNIRDMNNLGMDFGGYAKGEMASTGEMKNARASGLSTPLEYYAKTEGVKNRYALERQHDAQGHDIGMANLKYKIDQGMTDYKEGLRRGGNIIKQKLYDPKTGEEVIVEKTLGNRLNELGQFNNNNNSNKTDTYSDDYNPILTAEENAMRGVSDEVIKNNQKLMNDPNSIAYTDEGKYNKPYGNVARTVNFDGRELIDAEVKKSENDKKQEIEAFKNLQKNQQVPIAGKEALKNLEEAQALLRSGLNVGAYGWIGQGWDKYGLGNEAQAANTINFSNIMGSNVLDQLQKMKGAISDKDREYLLSIGGGDLSQSPEALNALIERLKSNISNEIEVYEKQRERFDKGDYSPLNTKPFKNKAPTELSDDELLEALGGF